MRRRRSSISTLRRRRRSRSSSSLIDSESKKKVNLHKGKASGFDHSQTLHLASVALGAGERPFAGYVNLEYVRLGCFARASDDKDPISELRDKFCKGGPTREPCRSNLPFFRTKVEPDVASDECFSFCTSKGFDVFGLLDDRTECRCGATKENVAIWGKWITVATNREIVWNYPEPIASASGDGRCNQVEVYRYAGWLEEPEADGVSPLLLRASLRDVQYIDSLVRGDKAPATPSLGNVAIPANQHLAKIGDLWPAGEVNFAFMPELDQPGRHAFLQAAKVWSYFSFDCVTFKEVKAPVSQLEVSSSGIGNKETSLGQCGPDEVGYPGEGKKRLLSLAGCGNVLHLHHVVQAIGNVLGLAVDVEGSGLEPETIKKVLETYKCYGDKSSSFAQTQQGSTLLQEITTARNTDATFRGIPTPAPSPGIPTPV